MNRRSFFQSLARAAAIVALAPQLAFRVRPERLLVSEYVPVLEFKANAMGVYAQLQAYGAVLDTNAKDSPEVKAMFDKIYGPALARDRNARNEKVLAKWKRS